jgi:hypothetical protein
MSNNETIYQYLRIVSYSSNGENESVIGVCESNMSKAYDSSSMKESSIKIMAKISMAKLSSASKKRRNENESIMYERNEKRQYRGNNGGNRHHQ